MHLKSGTLLQGGKYRIIRFIKSGGFGCTYEAVHTVFDERVAIKEFFPKDFCNRDEDTLHITVGTQSKTALVAKLKRKFIEEAVALRKLPHSGIVKVADVFEENGTAYYVMDYIDGCSLDDIVKREGALAEAKALSYIRQVCAALDYVHSQNRLHLDIKPGNVMVDPQGRTVLIDFGTSKQYDEENGENTSTIMGMTPGYAPLEQYKKGGIQQFTPATDIYSLGATLYKLVTGKTPPEADEVFENGGIPYSLSEIVSDSVYKALGKAMSAHRKDRPQSVGEFLDLLDDVQVVEVEVVEEIEGNLEEDVTEFTDERRDYRPEFQIQYRNNCLVINGIEYPMARVQNGFYMRRDNSRLFSSGRRYVIKLDTYAIGKYPVTQHLWETLMGDNPSHFKGPKRPVENVSWSDCHVFIRKLNALTGKNFRLPTEAEWEFAALGGNSSHDYLYCGGNNVNDVAWYAGNSGGKTNDVGLKLPNELGIYDMSGNVSEWCSDWYGPLLNVSQTNPKGPVEGAYRVLRGGSWNGSYKYCMISYRGFYKPDNKCNSLGFRLCL